RPPTIDTPHLDPGHRAEQRRDAAQDHRGSSLVPDARGPWRTLPGRPGSGPAPGGLTGGAPGLAHAGPHGGAARPTRALSGIPPVPNKNTIVPTTPGTVAGCPPPAGTARVPAHRRLPLPRPHSPWWPSTPGPAWSARPAPAGCALGSRAALEAAPGLWSGG